MTIYDGGSQDLLCKLDEKKATYWTKNLAHCVKDNSSVDNRLGELTGDDTLLKESTGNQIFISFVNNGNGIGKGFSGSIKFSKHHFCSKSVLTQVFFRAELRGRKAFPSRQG